MIKEAKNIDFYTSGREPSEQDFVRISEWISAKKKNSLASKKLKSSGNSHSQSGISNITGTKKLSKIVSK